MPVYPRWRGEHDIYGDSGVRPVGLSPLARGTRGDLIRNGYASRFIPAGAGNTFEIPELIVGDSVYPRWRGEHLSESGDLLNGCGLSPLARGTHPHIRDFPDRRRFIPAGAGNTNFYLLIYLLVPVYPRWRGEHTKKIDFNINSF